MSERKSTEVPGQLFGYSLQETRMLFRLLSAKPGDIVSVEVFDDVGQDSAKGGRVAEQTKTALDRNPVSDNAVDLWKTFRNWLNAVKSNKIEVSQTSFELYLTTKKTGTIVQSFNDAKTPEQAKAAYDAAKTELTPKGKGKTTEAQKLAAEFFADADKTVACQII